MANTIPKFDQPIQYSYTYNVLTGKGAFPHTMVGMLLPDQDSFNMEPGSKLSLFFPEVPDAGQQWTAASPSKQIQIQDNGFYKTGDPKAVGGSGAHNFLIQMAGMVPEGTPVHFVLNRFGKAVAERTLGLVSVETVAKPA